MAPPHSLEVTQQAMLIFTIIQAFIRNGGDNRRQCHAKLESLPQEFESIPFRQVYRLPPGSHNLACPHWEASELSFSGAGNLWCFTQLLRSGRNITRKTEDGQTWESRNGRERKNGYPTEIFVNRLVLSGQPFDMIELTLDERVVPCTDLPTVALCQIRWTQPGNNVAASSQQDSSNVNISDTATSMEGKGAGGQEETTEMEIDPPPPVEAPHVGPPQDSSNVNVVRLGASTSQEGEEANQEGTMDFQLVEPPPPGDVSDWRKDYLECKEAVSFLHRMMAKLEMICCYSCEAHRITSLVQSAASIVRDEANRLEIVLEEPEGTRLDTFSSTQQHDFAAARDSNFPEVEDQRLQPHRHTGTEPGIFEDDCVDVSEDYFLNLGGGGAA